MILKDIENNEKIIARLEYITKEEQLSHAYIFEGNRQCDKKLVADCFIKAVLCENSKGTGCSECAACKKIEHGNHEDVMYVEKSGNSIKDEAIEELQSRLKNKPVSGFRNIAVIQDADTMTIRAQNRLLKTLEEPNPGTIIILLSENVENLLQTVRSRCVMFHLNPFLSKDYSQIMEDSKNLLIKALHREPFYILKEDLQKLSSDKEQAEFLLDAMELCCKELAMSGTESRNMKAKIFEAVHLIEEARTELQQGLNVGYTMKKLILKFGG